MKDINLDQRLGFVGTSGSGKTYGAGVYVENLLAKKSRAVIIDPLGVWYGLRLQRDGKRPSKFNIPIFGGKRGDLPLTELSGSLIGETVAGMQESAILDLSEIGTKAGERRFMLGFLTALFRKHSGSPLHLIIDEADMFAPQQIRDKDGEAAKLLGMMETIIRRGRVKGFIPWLITQRPAVLNKDVLSQIDGMAVFKLTSPQDLDQIGAWVQGAGDRELWKAVRQDLPRHNTGEAVLWMPSLGEGIERIYFPLKATYDSSRTPRRGEKLRAATLEPLDIGKVTAALARLADEIKANDPATLKKRIAELEKAVKVPASNPVEKIDMASIKAAEKRGWDAGHAKGTAEAISVLRKSASQASRKAQDAVAEISALIQRMDEETALAQARSKPSPAIPTKGALSAPTAVPDRTPVTRYNLSARPPGSALRAGLVISMRRF